MYALIDSNNFFVSCERIFRPDLQSTPVIVLSSNDGCAVARSNEAKTLGIKMGEPLHELKRRFAIITSTLPYAQRRREREASGGVRAVSEQSDENTPRGASPSSDYSQSGAKPRVVAFSANFELYGDISRRIASTLARITPRIELYSIDEAFVDISQLDIADYPAWGRGIAAVVQREVGVPVSVGIAPTKTLCKLAADYAKKHIGCQSAFYIEARAMSQEARKATPHRSKHNRTPYQAKNDRNIVKPVRSTDASEKRAGGCGLSASKATLPSEEERAPLKDWESLLATTPISSVWGVGWRLAPRLKAEGIHTALDLAGMPPKRAQQLMGIQGRRTVAELGGTMCIPLAYTHKPQQVISRGRQFGRDTQDFVVIEAAIARMTSQAAQTLRSEKRLACSATVTISTNRKKPGYTVIHRTAHLYTPTADTGAISRQLTQLLKHTFDGRHQYHKTEVTLWNLVAQDPLQTDVFGFLQPAQHDRSTALMQTLDHINQTYGQHTIRYAAEDLSHAWHPRRNQMSPRYTTSWTDLPLVRAAQSASAHSC